MTSLLANANIYPYLAGGVCVCVCVCVCERVCAYVSKWYFIHSCSCVAAKAGSGGSDPAERAPGCLDQSGHHTGVLPEHEHQSKSKPRREHPLVEGRSTPAVRKLGAGSYNSLVLANARIVGSISPRHMYVNMYAHMTKSRSG